MEQQMTRLLTLVLILNWIIITGILTVKIPWQSLYTAPVELDLKKLYLLVVPSHSVAYNEEVEEHAIQAAKQKEIARIEDIRKREQLKKAGTQSFC